jgi:peroxiredoxin Q/BCP
MAEKRSKKKTTTKKPAAPAARPAATAELREGMKAPSFSLPSDTGETVSLAQFAGRKVVLYFYPKDSTPGCTQQACDFRDSFARVQAAGAVVLGVSRDSVASHAKFKAAQALPFPLLADVDGRVCEAYGVWKEKSLYGRKFMGIERTTFVIGADGRVARVFPKVKVSGHVDQVLATL